MYNTTDEYEIKDITFVIQNRWNELVSKLKRTEARLSKSEKQRNEAQALLDTMRRKYEKAIEELNKARLCVSVGPEMKQLDKRDET